MSPTLFQEYGNDIPACMLSSIQIWKSGEAEDRQQVTVDTVKTGQTESIITQDLREKNESVKALDEKHDEILVGSI